VGPIHHCEPPHAHSPDVASGTVARRLRIDVHDNADDNDNAWQRGPLWPHGMGPMKNNESRPSCFRVMRTDGQTDRQTSRQTDILIAILRTSHVINKPYEQSAARIQSTGVSESTSSAGRRYQLSRSAPEHKTKQRCPTPAFQSRRSRPGHNIRTNSPGAIRSHPAGSIRLRQTENEMVM